MQSIQARTTREEVEGATLHDDVETAFFCELVKTAVRRFSARTVLDVGCGNGLATLSAARAGASRVVGIDIAQRNVELARANVGRAGLAARVSVLHAAWQQVSTGRLPLERVDLLVANPPYVPHGHGTAVDGGPTGTTMLDSVIAEAPRRTSALALLFGSISDPMHVLGSVMKAGFVPTELVVRSVPFGRYTSRAETLQRLLSLRREAKAWFCDSEQAPHAPHAYLTLGLLAERAPEDDRCALARRTLATLLEDYQDFGVTTVPVSSHHISFDADCDRISA